MKLEYQKLPNYHIVLHDDNGNKEYLCTIAYDDSDAKFKVWHVFDLEDELELTFEEMQEYLSRITSYLKFDFGEFKNECRKFLFEAIKKVPKNGSSSEKYTKEVKLNKFASVEIYMKHDEYLSGFDTGYDDPAVTDYQHVKLLDLPAIACTVETNLKIDKELISNGNERIGDSRFTLEKSIEVYFKLLLKHLLHDIYVLGSPNPTENRYYIDNQEKLNTIINHDRKVLSDIDKNDWNLDKIQKIYSEKCYLSNFYDSIDYSEILDEDADDKHLWIYSSYQGAQINMGKFDWLPKAIEN